MKARASTVVWTSFEGTAMKVQNESTEGSQFGQESPLTIKSKGFLVFSTKT